MKIIFAFFISFYAIAEADYAVLFQEHQQQHQALNKRYHELISDFQSLKSQAFEQIKENFGDKFTEKQLASYRQASENFSYPVQLGPSLELVTKVFENFSGHWRGSWHQDNYVEVYDHQWDQPIYEDGYLTQKVVMGPWQEQEGRLEDKWAINSFHVDSKIVLGAVGVKEAEAETALFGIVLDETTIIWVATWGQSGEYFPYYSLFFETVAGKSYEITGVGFHWDRAKKQVLGLKWKEGHYRLQSN